MREDAMKIIISLCVKFFFALTFVANSLSFPGFEDDTNDETTQKSVQEKKRKKEDKNTQEEPPLKREMPEDLFKAYFEAEKLFKSDNELDKQKGGKTLRKIAQEKNDDYNRYEAATMLYEKGNNDDKEIGRKVLISLARSEFSDYPWNDKAATTLYKGKNNDDKKIGKEVLISLTKEKCESTVKIAQLFFEEGDIKEKNIGRKLLYDTANNPEDYYRCSADTAFTDQLRLQIYAVNSLIKNGNEEDQKVAKNAIKETYDNRDLFSKGNPIRVLEMMGCLKNHFQFRALVTLLNYYPNSSSIYSSQIPSVLGRETAEQIVSLCKEKISFHQQEEQYETGKQLHLNRYEPQYLEGMKYIALQEDHLYRFDAAKSLYENGDWSYSSIGEKVLREISLQKDSLHQKEAEHLLSWCSIM